MACRHNEAISQRSRDGDDPWRICLSSVSVTTPPLLHQVRLSQPERPSRDEPARIGCDEDFHESSPWRSGASAITSSGSTRRRLRLLSALDLEWGQRDGSGRAALFRRQMPSIVAHSVAGLTDLNGRAPESPYRV